MGFVTPGLPPVIAAMADGGIEILWENRRLNARLQAVERDGMVIRTVNVLPLGAGVIIRLPDGHCLEGMVVAAGGGTLSIAVGDRGEALRPLTGRRERSHPSRSAKPPYPPLRPRDDPR